MYLLDTNICIYLMKNSYPHLSQKLLSFNPSEIAISSITLYELEYGAAKSHWGQKTRDRMHMFLSPFTILPFDSTDAIAAGKIRGYLEMTGKIIGPYDLLIAAQGLARDLTVVTHNTNEFQRVPGLLIEDWIL